MKPPPLTRFLEIVAFNFVLLAIAYYIWRISGRVANLMTRYNSWVWKMSGHTDPYPSQTALDPNRAADSIEAGMIKLFAVFAMIALVGMDLSVFTMPRSFDDWVLALAQTAIGFSAWRMSMRPLLNQPRGGRLFKVVAIYCWVAAFDGVWAFPDSLERLYYFLLGYLLLNGFALFVNQRQTLRIYFQKRRQS